MITQNELKKVLNYDPVTGIFTWKTGGRKHKGGDIAGQLDSKGYVRINYKYKTYFAHRLAWLYVHGKWPDGVLDHRRGIRHDNRISELRDVTQAVNMQGFRNVSTRNKTGYTGVSWNERLKGFTATRMVNGKAKFLGVFEEVLLAANAYKNAHRIKPADPKRYRPRQGRPCSEWCRHRSLPATKSLTTGNFRATLRAMATVHRNARYRVKPFLEKLRSREMTNRQVAEILEINEQHLCRVLAELGFEREPAIDRKAQKQATADKKARIAEFAKSHPPEEAARLAGVSVRTIYRYLNKGGAK